MKTCAANLHGLVLTMGQTRLTSDLSIRPSILRVEERGKMLPSHRPTWFLPMVFLQILTVPKTVRTSAERPIVSREQ